MTRLLSGNSNRNTYMIYDTTLKTHLYNLKEHENKLRNDCEPFLKIVFNDKI